MQKITVLLADDRIVVRQGLRALLIAEEDIEIVGEADNGRQAVQLVKKFLPDVVVMDIAMPVLNGLEATRQITRAVPSTKVLVLSSYSDDEYVQQLTEAGAAGYLVKQTAANDLLKAIREAYRGNAYFSPAIAKRLRDHCREALAGGQALKRRSDYLTAREAEVLQLIAEGGRPASEPEPARDSALRLGLLTLRFDTSRAVWAGRTVDLTLTEFKILTLLAEKAGQDVGYREIYDLVHGKNFIAGHGSEGYRANVRTFIKRIRKKFRDVDSGFDHIENYAGFGYRWTAEG